MEDENFRLPVQQLREVGSWAACRNWLKQKKKVFEVGVVETAGFVDWSGGGAA
uniref:Uncharacterized protein n=1 Tax=Nelumbo nucifera TaxID=4432 RepID=A0A822ZQS8_NELNU|nr:TPA_asm: hypothetical protein HUJ06_018271 [Nelumbo nucifera]